MSDRRKPRLRRCLLCRQPARDLVHRKCYNCRVDMQMGRYARKGKLDKFLRADRKE